MPPARLLIIDDDANFLRVWAYILARAGFAVTAVANAEEAKAYLQTRPADLILCDVNLPGLDGPSFCEDLKASPRTRDIPVVMISARGDMARRAMSHVCGAKGYLEKPFCRCELLAVIQRVLREQRGHGAEREDVPET